MGKQKAEIEVREQRTEVRGRQKVESEKLKFGKVKRIQGGEEIAGENQRVFGRKRLGMARVKSPMID